MATLGGKRKGAGRPKGRKNKATLEKKAIQEAFNQRVMQHADKLFEAQLQLAVGSVQVYRVDEKKVGKKTTREHVLVTNPNEIKDVLDGTDASGGKVGDDYYFVTTVSPNNQAIEGMLNRTLGKPTENKQISVEGIDESLGQISQRELAMRIVLEAVKQGYSFADAVAALKSLDAPDLPAEVRNEVAGYLLESNEVN